MPTVAEPDSDSAPELSDKADSPNGAGDDEEEEEVEEEEPEMEEEEEEEEEEEGEEIEEEEEGDEGERQGQEEEGADLSDSAVAMDDEDDEDSEKVETEGNGEDLQLVSSAAGGSECSPALITRTKDHNGGSLTDHSPSVKMLATHSKEASDMIAGDIWSAVQDKHISSEKNGFPKPFVGNGDIKVLLKKESSKGSPEDGKISYIEAHAIHQSDLKSGDSTGAENTRSLQSKKNELAAEDLKRNGPGTGKYGVLEEVPYVQSQSDLQKPGNLSLSSMSTPQQRPRSPCSGATPGNLNKRPAIICSFYAKGWCIKGNQCKFLHQKEGTKEDLAGSSGKGEFSDGTGSRQEAENLGLSAAQESPDSSNTKFLSQSQLLQRALVRTYGGESHGPSQESHGPSQFHDDIAGDEFRRVDILQGGSTLARKEYKSRFGVNPLSSPMDERRSSSEDFLSRSYVHVGKLHEEMPKGEFLNGEPFSRGSPLTGNNLVPEYRYYSGGSSTTSSMYRTSNVAFAYGKTEDLAIRNNHSKFSPHGSYPSYSLTSTLSSCFSTSFQPSRISPSAHTFTQVGTSSTRDSTPFSAEHLDTHKTLDFDRGYYGSRSSSLPRNSSPYLSRPEGGNIAYKTHIQENNWEPSVPFRPSFYCTPASASSPGSQYDPILDSIEPRSAGNMTFQTSQRAIIRNVSDEPIDADSLLYGGHTPEYNVQKPPRYFPQTHEGIIDMHTSMHGVSVHTAVMGAPGPSAVDRGNSSKPKGNKHLAPRHGVESAKINDAELDGNLRSQVDKGSNHKESKALKIFRAALVEFVKELVKPSWRGGNLSKDAHKMIVKKAVEKVLSALQPHQVPSTTDSINQYLSTSRPKLVKLVEGYVDKYAKCGASNV